MRSTRASLLLSFRVYGYALARVCRYLCARALSSHRSLDDSLAAAALLPHLWTNPNRAAEALAALRRPRAASACFAAAGAAAAASGRDDVATQFAARAAAAAQQADDDDERAQQQQAPLTTATPSTSQAIEDSSGASS